MRTHLVPVALLAPLALAKTDYEGCTSFTSMVTVRPEPGYGNTYATVIWYDPSNLEICQYVDCGGGRAPPKTVPGCPAYSGTETVTPSFLPYDPMSPPPTSTMTVAVSATATDEESATGAAATADGTGGAAPQETGTAATDAEADGTTGEAAAEGGSEEGSATVDSGGAIRTGFPFALPAFLAVVCVAVGV